jgi:hypothetical protein
MPSTFSSYPNPVPHCIAIISGLELRAAVGESERGNAVFHPLTCALATYTGTAAVLNPYPDLFRVRKNANTRRSFHENLPGMEKK